MDSESTDHKIYKFEITNRIQQLKKNASSKRKTADAKQKYKIIETILIDIKLLLELLHVGVAAERSLASL